MLLERDSKHRVLNQVERNYLKLERKVLGDKIIGELIENKSFLA